MRLRLIPLFLAVAPFASADRLISLQTARKLTVGTMRAEYLSELSRGRTQMSYLAAGLNTSWEAELRTERFSGRDTKLTGDVVYNLVSPLAGFSPGMAFGVQDVAGTTRDGRQLFGCITFREEDEAKNGTIYQDVTLGVLVGRRTTPYLAVSFPFSPEIRLMLEASSLRAQAGVEIRPVRNLGLRLIAREQDLLGSVSYTVRF
ncbi:hypothetical protein EON82_03730 [bacterium]|nr:MAG: hypothetical protein EON82_03730 [bacterium]